MQNIITRTVGVILALLLSTGGLMAQATITPNTSGVVYVKQGSSGNGSSWTNAAELADAILAANSNPSIKQIRVAAGTYKPMYRTGITQYSGSTAPDDRDNTFLITGNIQIYGGFPTDASDAKDTTLDSRDWEANPVILSGDLDGSGVLSDGDAYHVVTAVGASDTSPIAPLLDGVTITGGYSTDGSGATAINGLIIPRTSGAGIYNRYANLTLSHAVVKGNKADYNGGGMYNNSSSPVITHVTISGNTASSDGGGMYNEFSSPVLTNSFISGNKADNNGGGMYNYNFSPVIANATISGNTANGYGGGMYNNSSSPVITNATISGNKASSGSGMYNDSSSPDVNNSIIWGNENSNNIENNGYSIPTYTYSLVEGVTDDAHAPQFVNADAGNYRLVLGSPGMDEGDKGIYWTARGLPADSNFDTETDLAGNPRLTGGIIDMGAYEYITPSILYVKKGLATGAKDGSNWANALPELADAIEAANSNPSITQIRVAAGTYKPMYHTGITPYSGSAPGDRDKTFLITGNVRIYGGFPADASDAKDATLDSRDWETYPVILSGDLDGSGTLSDGDAYHVVTAVGPSDTTRIAPLIDGVTITGGYSTSGAGNTTINGQTISRTNGAGIVNRYANLTLSHAAVNGNTAGNGGGMYNSSSSPVIINGTISGNKADLGGGMCNSSSSSPVITNGAISGNTANYGGGMYNYSSSPVLTNATISGNTATTYGGGMYNDSSSSIITNGIISGNTASYGGGMYNATSSSPVITQVAISGNTADYGGGMYNASSYPVLTNVTISGNTAYNGGGMYNASSYPVLTNATISGNKANSFGGGMYNVSSSSPVITNGTISGNTADYGGGMYNNDSSPSVNNSIIWGNGSRNINNSTLTYKHSLVEGVTDDAHAPQFVNAAAGNYCLAVGSPGIDEGDNATYWTARGLPAGSSFDTETDLDGNPRLTGGTIDMGAYECTTTFTPPSILYVKKGGEGLKDGSDWANALPELAGAIEAANSNPNITQIRVAAGTYKPMYRTGITQYGTDPAPDDRDNTFLITGNVKIYGGFPADASDGKDTTLDNRDWETYPVILSGDLDADGALSDGDAYHVVTAVGTKTDTIAPLLDGVTITGGYSTGVSGSTIINRQTINRTYGAGIYNRYANLTLSYAAVSGNTANFYGGGMYNESSSPVITRVTISGNTAGYGGGGMYNESSSPVITNGTISGNTANGYGNGGGMYNSYSSPVIINGTISGNMANYGGGMYNDSSSFPVITNGVISGNTATNGSGMFNSYSSPVLTNVTISGNTATNVGGGMSNNSYSSPVLTNVTISGNTATNVGGGMYNYYSATPNVNNSIIWENGRSNIYNDNSTPAYTYSLVEGVTANDNAPQFVDADAGNYRLAVGSPGIDEGDNATYWTARNLPADSSFAAETDPDGNPRLIGDRIDMGAYESKVTTTTTGMDAAPAIHLAVYPNPTTGRLTVNGLKDEHPLIRLFDLAGRLVFTTREATFDISRLPDNPYLLEAAGTVVKVIKREE